LLDLDLSIGSTGAYTTSPAANVRF
jgi:hypothetical protein